MGWHMNQSVAPTAEPVTLAEAKAHMRITHGDDDDRINAMIESARAYAEQFTNRQFVTATWTLKLDGFRDAPRILLPRPPLSSITSITYYDTADASQTWASAGYVVVTDDEPGWFHLAPDQSYPSTSTERYDAVTVTYVAGYGAASAVPAGIKQAIMVMCETMYEFTSEIIVGTIRTKIPEAAERLLGPYVIPFSEKPWQSK